MYLKIIVLTLVLFFTVLVNAQLPGDLDPSYADEGIKKIPVGNASAFGQSLVIQPDGKSIVAITASNGTNNDFALLRLNPDGEPDHDFGDEGIIFTDFAGKTDSPQSVTLDSSGRIIVTGYVDNGTSFDFGVARYLPDGSPDLSFGEQGLVTTTLGITAFAETVTVQKDQKIIAGGYALNPVTLKNEFTLVRYQENGDRDSTFHEDGIVMTDMVIGAGVANAVLVQDDGKILLAGQVFNELDFTWVVGVARYHPNGDLDESWHEDGIVYYASPFTLHTITSMVIDHEGRVVVGGFNGTAPSNTLFTLARFQTNGIPDGSLAGDGMVILSFGGQNNQITSLAVQPDGKILAGGSTSFGNEVRFVVARFLEEGSFDATFGEGGVVVTEIGELAGIKSIALQSDGKLLVAGESFDGNKFVVTTARYITGLSTDTDPVFKNAGFGLYPNPAYDILFVKLDLLQPANIQFEIFDIMGRLLHSFPTETAIAGNFQKALNLPDGLNSGVYSFRLTVNESMTGRLIMIH